MLKITLDGESGEALRPFGYTVRSTLPGRLILPVTRWQRAVNSQKYMTSRKRHLDIGCGDGYFLRRSRCEERFGLDKLLGDEVTDTLEFPDDSFDYVTMLAVIEHIARPEAVLKEIRRILKPGGRLIITTPRQAAHGWLKLYASNIEEKHDTYFDLEKMKRIANIGFVIEGYNTFLFGLNQVFCLRKIN